MNYMARLAQLETRQSATDRTDKSSSVGFVSPLPAHIETESLDREADQQHVLMTPAEVAAIAPAQRAPFDTGVDASVELRALVDAVADFHGFSSEHRAEAMQNALADPEAALECFRILASRIPTTEPSSDDRRTCQQCANLTGRGLCLAARRGEIVASSTYEPARDLHRRCEGYAPGPDDLDRRPGRKRWPGLIQKGD